MNRLNVFSMFDVSCERYPDIFLTAKENHHMETSETLITVLGLCKIRQR